MRGGDWVYTPFQKTVAGKPSNLMLDLTAPNPLLPNVPGNPSDLEGGIPEQLYSLFGPWKTIADVYHDTTVSHEQTAKSLTGLKEEIEMRIQILNV